MMQVLFIKNVGSLDAIAHGLDFRDCAAGACCDVADDIANSLIAKRLARLAPVVKAVSAAASTEKAATEKPSAMQRGTKSDKSNS